VADVAAGNASDAAQRSPVGGRIAPRNGQPLGGAKKPPQANLTRWEMTPDEQRTERARIRHLLPAWDGGRWTVEGQGYAFRVRRFWRQPNGKEKSQYYFLLPWESWKRIAQLEDDHARRILLARCERKRRALDAE
jgi:hypothetical protein